MASWRRSIAHLQLQRIRHIVEYRLGRRHRNAGILAADARDFFVKRSERGEEGLEPGSVVIGVCRIGRAQSRRKRGGDRGHGRRVIPKMRIVARLSVQEVSRNDRATVGLRRCGEELLHPRIVVGTVVNDDLCAGDLADDGRRDLEQVRVLVGIAHDAGDGNLLAADLPSHVAVKILRCHDRDFAVRRMRCRKSRKYAEIGGGDRQKDFHAFRSLAFLLQNQWAVIKAM